MIKCSLPDNNTGCYIITTTRILSVAEQVGIAYKLRPLSLQNSRKLLYRRIFGNKKKIKNEDPEKYPDDELTEVSNNILKKCGGVPLALITIASLLASKGINKIEWYEVYNSVGTGLENSFDLANMRKILSFSYYDLPPHLRTCLLYLSIFPEDYNIGKDRLIWIWIAEGFIQREKQGKSLFELGEGYFNELINRSMIQPVHNKDNGTIEYCRVHDMVLDFIRSLSREENFVTIYNNMDNISIIPNTVRRLSLQTDEIDHATCVRSMQQVRSVVVFPSAFKLQISVLESFRVLRVLDFIDCYLLQDCSLKCLGNLVHLRYLGLSNTSIAQLPEDIGNLRFLQTLDLRRNRILRLPSTIIDLKHLMCLRVDAWTTVPNGIGSLTSLEELSKLSIDSSMDIIEDMGHLTKLRVLNVDFLAEWNESIKNSLVESLSKLQKLRSIDISIFGECNLDAWVVPRRLCRFAAPTRRLGYWFSKLPYWMNPSLLHLAFLSITLRELQQKDLEILGRLPALRNLDLEVGEDIGICGTTIFYLLLIPMSDTVRVAWIYRTCGVSEKDYAKAHKPPLYVSCSRNSWHQWLFRLGPKKPAFARECYRLVQIRRSKRGRGQGSSLCAEACG
ncbi:hypothetical protein QOZ80_9AG0689910 [Eleusine coracana subsp. coracana]|nr:hypothetical protein QOZ80_9AG0689910 [Eleusine coracana subsp. coracana]